MSDELHSILEASNAIPGWTRGDDAMAVARASLSLGEHPVIVEIGVFLGCSTVLLAGARRVRGSGVVHCIDPFDLSGDAFSTPHYRQILDSLGGGSSREHFEANISRAGLSDWVETHQGRATEIAACWTRPIDLLLLDGDQSPQGAKAAFECWEPFLKPGGMIVLRNTRSRDYAAGHDGHRRLVLNDIVPPRFGKIRQIGATTFARKAQQSTGRSATRVDLYAQCWNDEFMLPFFFRHYDSFVDRYVIYDDGSTDRSLTILQEHPKVELRRFDKSSAQSFVISEQTLSNHCWKESRGAADWVIVTDLDEHLFHPGILEYLGACGAAGVTLIPALGFQMISEKLPQDREILCDALRFGAPWAQMMKPSIFNPDAIDEINFLQGRHFAAPTGTVRVPERDEVLLLHYKYIDRRRTHARHRELLSRLGEEDLYNNWGHKYSWSLEQLAQDWQAFAEQAVDVREITADTYPVGRWWLPQMATVPVQTATNGRGFGQPDETTNTADHMTFLSGR